MRTARWMAGLSLVAVTAGLGAAAAWADDTIKFGALATLEGPFTELGKDGMRGVEMAIAEVGGEVAGKKIVLTKASSDGNPEVALQSARRLVDQDKVQILVGPLSGSEGIAMRDYAKTVPGVTFFNGGSAAIETTLVDPAPNFYRFNTEGAQWTASLGTYIAKERGWKKMVLVAEDYSFPYAQIFGFMGTYCAAGGHMIKEYYVPLGTKDYSAVIAQLPDKGEADGMFVVLGGSDAVNFLTQYTQAGGELPMVGGSIAVDQTVLSAKGPARAHLPGVLSSGPVSDNDQSPAWRSFVSTYQKTYPDGLPSPSLFAFSYYTNAKAALIALKQVGGDLSDNEVKFRKALDTLAFDTPTGPVSINANRQATAAVFVNEIKDQNGTLVSVPISKQDKVDQTLGLGEVAYKKLGLPSRDNPTCP